MRHRVRIKDGGREGTIYGYSTGAGGNLTQFKVAHLDGTRGEYTEDQFERIPNPRWLARFHEMPEASQMDMIEKLFEAMRSSGYIAQAESHIRDLRQIARNGDWYFPGEHMIQLKWSDEDVWKDHKPLDPSRSVEEQLAEVARQWAADRAKYQLKHDAEFRVKPAMNIDEVALALAEHLGGMTADGWVQAVGHDQRATIFVYMRRKVRGLHEAPKVWHGFTVKYICTGQFKLN